jgi:hypothetical protein
MIYHRIYLCFLLIGILPGYTHAGNSESHRLAPADYMKAERFLSWNMAGKIIGGEVTPQWVDDDRFWYRNRFASSCVCIDFTGL